MTTLSAGGGPLTGTGVLARLALRRDRVMLPIWVYVVVIGVASNAFTFARLYKTESSRQSLVASGLDNPALIFLYGRLNGDSVGALTAWRYGVWGALFAALMSVFLVVRHTRADEEAGRLELIGSARVGRQAPLASALAVAVLANALLTAALCLILPPLGLRAGWRAACSASPSSPVRSVTRRERAVLPGSPGRCRSAGRRCSGRSPASAGGCL